MLNKDIEAHRKKLGEELMSMRINLSISKSEFHRFSGIGRQQINDIESGSSSYTIDTYIRYCQALKDFNKTN